jgi:hypothetical protein
MHERLVVVVAVSAAKLQPLSSRCAYVAHF